MRLAVRSGLYPVYEVFDGDRVVIDVEPEPSPERADAALAAYFQAQGRFRKEKVDLARVRAGITRGWERLRRAAARV